MSLADDELPVWTFRVNWKDPVVEQLAWLTDIPTSRSGVEQRRACRVTPRRSFEFALLLNAGERTFFDLAMMEHGRSDWLLPIWHDASHLTAAVEPGATNLPCAVVGREFVAGGHALLLGPDALTYERVSIESVSGGLTLADGTAKTWPSGTRVFPLVRAFLEASPSAKRLTSRVFTTDVRLSLTRGQNWTGEATLPAYRNRPVLVDRPNEADDWTQEYASLLAAFDAPTGLQARVDRAGRGFTAQQFRWRLRGRDQHAAFRNLLYTLRGRQRAIWVPSYNDDLSLASAASAGSNQIVVRAVGMAMLGPVLGRQDVEIELASGVRLYRRISSAHPTPPAGQDVLTLDQAHGVALTPANVRRISFMDVFRLEHDTVEIEHVTDQAGVSNVSTVFRSIPDIRVEDEDNYLPIPHASAGGAGATYEIVANEIYTADLIAREASDTLPYDLGFSDLAIGSENSYAGGRKLIWPVALIETEPTGAGFTYPNATGATIKSGAHSFAPGALYDPYAYGNLRVFEKDLDTGEVVSYDPYSPTAVLPGGQKLLVSTYYGEPDQWVIDQRNGDIWLCGQDIYGVGTWHIYVLRRADGYAAKLDCWNPQYPGLTVRADRSPYILGMTADWVYVLNADTLLDFRISLIPRLTTAEEVSQGKLLTYALYPLPEGSAGDDQTYLKYVQVFDGDGNLWLYGLHDAGAGHHFRLWKLTPPTSATVTGGAQSQAGGGWSEKTPWLDDSPFAARLHALGDSLSTAPQTLHWLPGDNALAMINWIPATYASADAFAMSCTYFDLDAETYTYFDAFVSKFMSAAWTSTVEASAAYIVKDAIEVNGFLHFGNVLAGQEPDVRWFAFQVFRVTETMPEYPEYFRVFACYRFANGEAPTLVAFYPENLWDDNYPGWQGVYGPGIIEYSIMYGEYGPLNKKYTPFFDVAGQKIWMSSNSAMRNWDVTFANRNWPPLTTLVLGSGGCVEEFTP